MLFLQVLFQPGAVDGCGKTAGEAGEQLFAGLSPLGRTTCHQSVAGMHGVSVLVAEACVTSNAGYQFMPAKLLYLHVRACLAGSTDCITEHCVEIARVKRAGQAAFLVEKLEKYSGMLAAAEGKLQQLLGRLTQHRPDEQRAFVLRMRDALKAHAKGAST